MLIIATLKDIDFEKYAQQPRFDRTKMIAAGKFTYDEVPETEESPRVDISAIDKMPEDEPEINRDLITRNRLDSDNIDEALGMGGGN
mmetsp:Transcript_15509/g.13260  ORF Transcript_15509/g.13260 Transcript_15509/m.13260 type:complete len:87 (+) Transcript_15509:1227-1487(+)